LLGVSFQCFGVLQPQLHYFENVIHIIRSCQLCDNKSSQGRIKQISRIMNFASSKISSLLLAIMSIPHSPVSPLRHPLPSSSRTTSAAAATPPDFALYRRRTLAKGSRRRYYASWNPTQLCASKTSFDAWEDSFGSLEECCGEVFGWDYDDCMRSDER